MSIYREALERAVSLGVRGAALVDRQGDAVALAGDIDEDEAMPLAAYAMYRKQSKDLAARLFDGEILTVEHEDREVAVGIAKRMLFVVVILGADTQLEDVRALYREVEELLAQDKNALDLPPLGGTDDGNGGAGPAELALAEYGITMPRVRPQA